ncbi:DUF5047 domain-containing protein [Micromonospora avicenniae]|uniref:DUF5047 domain-containing protein n=1 Tax=Micromonospora avicenniae TaxID=1198245 RepID=A0A1N6PST7_9ACTN|nr:DUF5047 domain-containing protein [Micromonospora avicenniae]SIQ07381.1 protein of unknown function [Micromonospora avicenniae]
MIPLSEEALSVLTRSYRLRCAVESWLGDELLAAEVPVETASEETDRSLRVPERVTFTVPRYDRGVDWSPVTDDHPLAANGQRLRVQLGIEIGNGVTEWFQRGWFVIEDSIADGDSVSVAAVGLLSLVEEARLVSPYQPSGTLFNTLRGLVEPALTVTSDGLIDRAVPSGINYDEDRLGAVLELLDAWEADARVTEDGYLYVSPAEPSRTPVLSLTDGQGGTVIQATGSSAREGAFNVVVARGTAPDGGQIQGVAYDYSGPKRHGGPFNPLPVPYFYSSPLLTTVAQANSAARTVLARLKRSTAKEFQIEMVPHPGLQAGDTVAITTEEYTDLLCVVEALNLPYTAGGGSQRLTLRSLS